MIRLSHPMIRFCENMLEILIIIRSKMMLKKMTFEIFFFFRQKNPIKICIWEILIHFKAIIYLNYFVWKLFVYFIVAYGIHTYTHTHTLMAKGFENLFIYFLWKKMWIESFSAENFKIWLKTESLLNKYKVLVWMSECKSNDTQKPY